MKSKRWAVVTIQVGKTWDDLVKRVFNTYEAAMLYAEDANASKACSLVIVQDNAFFQGA